MKFIKDLSEEEVRAELAVARTRLAWLTTAIQDVSNRANRPELGREANIEARHNATYLQRVMRKKT